MQNDLIKIVLYCEIISRNLNETKYYYVYYGIEFTN